MQNLSLLLSRRNQLALSPGIRRPTTTQGVGTTVLGGVLLHSLLKLGAEMSNETLKGPGKSLTKS